MFPIIGWLATITQIDRTIINYPNLERLSPQSSLDVSSHPLHTDIDPIAWTLSCGNRQVTTYIRREISHYRLRWAPSLFEEQRKQIREGEVDTADLDDDRHEHAKKE